MNKVWSQEKETEAQLTNLAMISLTVDMIVKV